MGSETLPSACFILSDESSIPFYSTSNGYKYYGTSSASASKASAQVNLCSPNISQKSLLSGYLADRGRLDPSKNIELLKTQAPRMSLLAEQIQTQTLETSPHS